MPSARQILKAATALCAATFLSGAAALAEDADLDPLFEALKGADPGGAQQIENKIWDEWS